MIQFNNSTEAYLLSFHTDDPVHPATEPNSLVSIYRMTPCGPIQISSAEFWKVFGKETPLQRLLYRLEDYHDTYILHVDKIDKPFHEAYPLLINSFQFWSKLYARTIGASDEDYFTEPFLAYSDFDHDDPSVLSLLFQDEYLYDSDTPLDRRYDYPRYYATFSDLYGGNELTDYTGYAGRTYTFDDADLYKLKVSSADVVSGVDVPNYRVDLAYVTVRHSVIPQVGTPFYDFDILTSSGRKGLLPSEY